MKKNKFYNLIISISSIFFLILIWQVIGGLLISSIIPTPLEIAKSFIDFSIQSDQFGHGFIDHLSMSLIRVIIGFYYALVVAIPLGLLMGMSKKIESFFNPLVEIARPIPPFAWIPFALVFFGLGIFSQSFIIFIGTLFPILTNTLKGVKSTSKIHMEVAQSLGATRFDVMIHVILPSTFPSILVGIRIGLGVGWMCVIAAELVGLNIPLGLGYLIQYSAQFGNFGLTFSAMLLTGLIGFGLNYIIKLIEKHSLKWRDTIG